MKSINFISALAILLAIVSCNNNNKVADISNSKLEFVWETDTLLTTCESALFDSVLGVIFVSNINNNPWDLDSNGFISTIDTTGNILELKWVEGGLSGPKGMGIHKGKLYVNDIDRLVEIDIASQKLINSYHVGGEPNLNDITVSDEGVVYSSGSSSNTIYRLQDGKFDTLHVEQEFNRLNGLLAQKEGVYYISSGASNFGLYDLNTSTTTVLAEDFGNGDGIIRLENNDFIVSDWKGQIFYINHLNWKSKRLLDTRSEGVFSADIGYIPEHKMLLVPTFFGNKVVCYRVIN